MPFHNQIHHLPENPFPAAVTWAQEQAKKDQNQKKKDAKYKHGILNLERTYNESTKIDCITFSVENLFKGKISNKKDIVPVLCDTAKILTEKGFINPKELEEIYLFEFNSGLNFFKRNGPSLKIEIKDNEGVTFTFQGDNLDKLMKDFMDLIIPKVPASKARL
jgi:hypothetical protein